jgi:UDP-N-acetylmuramoylalanine--D-glutamate ligase
MTTQPPHLENARLLILGLGREGWSSYQWCRQWWPDKELVLADELSREKLGADWQEALTNDPHLSFVQVGAQNTHPLECDVLIKTPGIPESKVRDAYQISYNQLSSNLSLFWEVTAQLPSATTIGVTGTKGKSTTTAVIHHILAENGLQARLGGNIGVPALDVLKDINPDEQLFLVLELSSHQLAEQTHSPDIAVVQPIVPEHLDYYRDFEEYWTAKSQITRHQTEKDLVIFNTISETALKLAELSQGEHVGFVVGQGSAKTPPAHTLTISNQILLFDHQELMPISQLHLRGEHNFNNIMPGIIIGQRFGLSLTQIAQALSTFQSLPHRLQKVAEVNGVEYFDDSLATNQEASVKAIEAFPDQQVVLIAGGFDRHQPHDLLAEIIVRRQVPTVWFPVTGEYLVKEIEQSAALQNLPIPPLSRAESMNEAVTTAAEFAQPGAVVLMSPAAASFNMFKDYADRGDQFKAAAQNLHTF